jgi:hypothetical protein
MRAIIINAEKQTVKGRVTFMDLQAVREWVANGAGQNSRWGDGGPGQNNGQGQSR